MEAVSKLRPKYLYAFLLFVGLYAVVLFSLSGTGAEKFPYLHLGLDTSNAILSLLLAVFLLGEQHAIQPNVRSYLVIGFSFAAGTELLHALIGIEWSGWFAWIGQYSGTLRPTTWPPSTYVLPLSMAWVYGLMRRQSTLSPIAFAVGMLLLTLVLFALSFRLPNYMDTGLLGIQRPTQVPLLLLWVVVIVLYWRQRHEHRLFEGLALMGVLLFLSDLCMLYSNSPHEKFTMMAHAGKLSAYVMLHVIQMRIAAEDNQARREVEQSLIEEKEHLSRALAEINKLARYDTLTNLANRRLLEERIAQAMALSKRSGLYGAILFLDLDNFKSLNDTHGHGAGDLLLIEAARRLSGCVREVDTVARFGGDEFVVLLSQLDQDYAKSIALAGQVADKIRRILSEPYTLKMQHDSQVETIVEHHSAASIGVVVFLGQDVRTEDMIKWADTAMYQAKKSGRNQFRYYEPTSCDEYGADAAPQGL